MLVPNIVGQVASERSDNLNKKESSETRGWGIIKMDQLLIVKYHCVNCA